MRISRSPSYLVKHKHIFYVRVSVPVDLRPKLGKTEYRYSLKTAFLREARMKSSRFATGTKELFNWLRNQHKVNTMNNEKIQAIADNHIRNLLHEIEMEWATTGTSNEAAMEHEWTGLDESLDIYRQALQDRNYSLVTDITDAIIKEQSLDLDKDDDAYKRLCRAVTQSSMEFCEIAKKRLQGVYKDRFIQTPPPPSSGMTESGQNETTGVPLTQVIEAYTQEQTHAGRWEEKSKQENIACYRLFLDYAGDDINTDQITYPLLREYKATLMKLPPNMRKSKLYRGKSIHELLEMDIPKTLSTTTINKYLNRIATLLKYAVKNGWMHFNPAEGMQLPDPRRDDELRTVFSNEDLHKLFHSPQYKEDTHNHAYQFWVLIIALFTGMRQNEIAQLYVDDIRQDHGLWVFDINANAPDKHLKTKNAKRLVPMHTFLSETLNLPQYAQTLRDRGEARLFPEIPGGRDRYGQTISRWFNGNSTTFKGYKTNCGVVVAEGASKKDFHSFRHTLINHLKQKLVDPLLLHEMDGHSHDSLTFGTYGKQYLSHIIYENVVALIDFHESLDLDHLANSRYVASAAE